MSARTVIAAHEAAGRRFTAAGVGSFALDAGRRDAAPVLCVHGVPVSSFVYRKVVRELAARGLRGVAVDLPGLGLADRPADFDYTWSGLGRWLGMAVNALGLETFHLVVHDIGGPVGFELAATMPGRVRSLTLLDTVVRVDEFERPWMMEPFARRGVGEVALRTLTRPGWRLLLRREGILDQRLVTVDELDAHLALLKRGDGGAAFLRIMRGFERTPEKRALYESVLRAGSVPYPVQVVWGAADPALPIGKHGEHARVATGLPRIHAVPARHFLQEDQAPAVAERVARLAASA